ncbi:glycoside hydrolase family 36 protein [Cellulophaga baltica]|uniref:glycoside hydrolase family 36 protein n=1 Tax=Cellulophaga baltica TaxID=76594 RepID=UPI0015F7157C|nr:glycoside hydrolase family 36 protein [Cellulophaga baltica]MBA6314155.1 alpha-galactosidase [Cellulophaga baltica]
MNVDSIEAAIEAMEIIGEDRLVSSSIQKINSEKGLEIYQFEVKCNEKHFPKPITIKWKVPGINVKGVWKPTTDFAKRIQADWELDHMESRISIDAPVISLFGHNDENIITFACSNAINKLQMNARIREEDNYFYCHITFFSEEEQPIENFDAQIRIDTREILFSSALKEVSAWWESFENLRPAHVPAIAKMPLYSTWYQFHQNLDVELLLEECKLASDLGYKAIIIDDGWQTFDTNRGYDYTGDWQPDRIPNMAEYIAKIKKTGLKAALWYSVPFCGPKSEAFKRFKGKFLTEDHRWAPVFDPRYPEVREYLINIYANAVKEWKLDGLKLDFIDDFRLYESTPLGMENGRDFASINDAVDRLMTDVMRKLQAINPDIFIEFRQKYVGPAMRKFGNMLRAFDCPGDATMNRIRIADIRMLAGNTAVHSDMVTWHEDEPVEVAALQLINILFGVPQLSMFLSKVSEEHKKMIAFYTGYWNKNATILMHGEFTPSNPLGNYNTQKVILENEIIIGVYDNIVNTISNTYQRIHLHNGKIGEGIILKTNTNLGSYEYTVFDCMGNQVHSGAIDLNITIVEISVPSCGIIQLIKK